jgi:hypothetical protein
VKYKRTDETKNKGKNQTQIKRNINPKQPQKKPHFRILDGAG